MACSERPRPGRREPAQYSLQSAGKDIFLAPDNEVGSNK